MRRVDFDTLQEGDKIVSWLTGQKRTVKTVGEDYVEIEERRRNGEIRLSSVPREYIDGRWLIDEK